MNSILCQEIKEVNQQISIIEAECAILRELLKPWPKRKSDQAKQMKEDTVTTKEKHLDEEDFGPEEKQTLKQVEELLSKAQKTLQSKLTITEVLDEEKNNESAIETSIANSSESLSGDNQQPPRKDLKPKELQSKERTPQNLNKSSQVVMKPKLPGITTTKSDAFNSSKLKQNSTLADKKTSRPSSNTRPSSTRLPSSRSSYVPVHLLAPFKTEQAKLPRSKSTLATSKRKTPASKQDSGFYTVPASQPLDQCQKNGAKEVKRSSNKAQVLHSPINKNNNCTPSSAAPDNEIVGDQIGFLETGEDIPETRSLPEQEFTLSSGCLKIPGKLKKLALKTQALRDQCYAAKTKHKGCLDPAQQFIDKLEAQTQIGKELRTQASALTCLRSHQILSETLENLHLDKISENSSFESIYRAKRILEFVLNKFSELQDEAEMFSKVQFASPQDVNTTESSQDHCWMDTGQHHHCEKKDKYLQYHLKRSKEWTRLKFEENYLRLQIRLTEQFNSEWHSILTSNKWEPSVVQGAYSLLTSFGQNLPALVKNLD
ncbi:uncharacterized protein LOC131929431 [Physella acuta]|uniref:uncharacterized protein LOC131929431 n=1 Tax=Physella acuta TaxID=109671 RepID=UPI0027DDCA40|nr:uncharacterized protein LOC131929431 [Physella acuta]